MSVCFEIQILNPPDYIPDMYLRDGTMWLSGNSEITTVQNRLELNDVNNVRIDGILSLTITQSPAAKLLIHDKWCPGSLAKIQEPYEITIWKGCEPMRQRFLYCVGVDDAACTYTLRATWGRDHWAIAFSECRLCDIFQIGGTDIFGGTIDTCESIMLGQNFIGTGIPDLWQHALNNHLYQDGDDGVIFLPAWYGGSQFDGNHVHPEDIFRPWFSFLHILRTGACICGGWRIKAPIFEVDLFRRAWVYILSKDYGNQEFINTYGSIQAGLNAHVWKAVISPNTLLSNAVALDPFSNPRTFCLVFDQVISDPFGIVDAGFFGTTPFTTFDLYNDVLIGACFRFRMILAESDWSGDVKLNLFSVGDQTTTNTVVLPGGNVINLPANVPNLLGSYNTNVSTDDMGNLIVEGEIDVDCIPLNKVTFLSSGYVYACLEFTPDETPSPEVPEFLIEYAEIWSKPKRHIYTQGDNIDFCDAVSCEKSFLDYLKGALHLIDGKLVEDIPTKTLCIYPPKNVEMPDGTLIEGYMKNEVVEFGEFVKCLSHVAASNNDAIDRYCRIGFAKSTDPFVENQTDGDNQIHDYLHDFGERFENDKVKEKRNPFFEPTAIRRLENISCNGTETYLPNLTDNDDEEISYEIGCRILLVGCGTQVSSGTGIPTEINYCKLIPGGPEINKIDEFAQGYHALTNSGYSII